MTDNVEQAERLVRIEMSQEAMRDDLTRYFVEFNTFVKENRTRIETLERSDVSHTEKIGSLSGQVKGWNITNSLGVIIAGVIGWFK